MPFRRHAFTYIELLIMMAILAILISLLLPAVEQCREAARRTVCKNNLAQLGLALQNYEMAFGVLPPGTTNTSGPIISRPSQRATHISWTVRILPYIELKNVYDRYDFAAGVYDARNLAPQQRPIPLFLCPSDGALPKLADGLFATNYAGVHNGIVAPIDVENDGLLYLNSSVRYANIFDGSSFTVLVGEKLRPAEVWGWASGTRDTLRNSGFLSNRMLYSGLSDDDPMTEEYRSALEKSLPEGTSMADALPGGFGSNHRGGFNCAMADGSVRYVNGLRPEYCSRDDGGMAVDF